MFLSEECRRVSKEPSMSSKIDGCYRMKRRAYCEWRPTVAHVTAKRFFLTFRGNRRVDPPLSATKAFNFYLKRDRAALYTQFHPPGALSWRYVNTEPLRLLICSFSINRLTSPKLLHRRDPFLVPADYCDSV